MALTEESAGQRLLDMEEEKQQKENLLESLEEQLRQCTAKSQITDSELQYPSYVCVCIEKCYGRVSVFSVSVMNPLSLYQFSSLASLILLQISAERVGESWKHRTRAAESSERGG